MSTKAVLSLIPEKRELLSKQGLGLGHVGSSLLNRLDKQVQDCALPLHRVRNGMLPGFKPDYIEIDDLGQEKRCRDVFAFMTKQLSEDNKYSALWLRNW